LCGYSRNDRCRRCVKPFPSLGLHATTVCLSPLLIHCPTTHLAAVLTPSEHQYKVSRQVCFSKISRSPSSATPSRTSSRSTYTSTLGAIEPCARLLGHRRGIAPLPHCAGAHPHRYLCAVPDALPSHVARRLPRGGRGGGCFLTMTMGRGFQTTCRWIGLQF
jgi:hypothetical protein